MKGEWMFAIGVVVGAGATTLPRLAGLDLLRQVQEHFRRASAAPLAHTEARFTFVAQAPLHEVAPLMGADRERAWAPGWNPHFIHPSPAADQPGMVFTVAHGHARAAWVNTAFDLNAGRVQYVYVVPDALVTVISLRLTPEGSATRVEVEYDRTALSAGANDRVRRLAENDRAAGPEWEGQINAWLRSRN